MGAGNQLEFLGFAQPDVGEAEVTAVRRVIESGWLTTGQECVLFDRELSPFVGDAQVVTMSSCTAALETAVAALRLRPGARVGVPCWTFASTALAAHHAGAEIVLLDVSSDTLNLSAESVSSALDEGLDALIAVHFGGSPVPTEIHARCSAEGVPVIEDAAHALGARDNRGLIGGGDSVATCLSFYATKNLTCGEGGALVTQNDDVADFARRYRLHGLSQDAWERYRPGGSALYELDLAGIKGNLPDLLAAIGRVQLLRFRAMQNKRRALVERYRVLLEPSELLECVPRTADAGSADHLMTVKLHPDLDRADVMARLGEQGIPCGVLFTPLHHFGWFKEHAAVSKGGLAAADSVARRILSLPLHARMAPDGVDRVVDALVYAMDL